ncbi:nucleotide-binding protein with a TIR-like domain [Empedobacter brevis NBRC 14943 = ATCC 43319]|uniref:Nucleotide-binding protein with a TIR-like domain n=1 Tax=Empedobacter brevis NBRC 14943 = ATCC 43319 TaxID=1218108 RepID=A0A511ND65_9FLAO|nr:nucleotide-binding protein [Empedobacter brevis]GEM50745.1 nucleotide-binding protein with a TIR-like domain [Empedobacter brevis NBRC 14943 = ATCC 43319]
MAKKQQLVAVDQTPTELTTSKEEFNEILDKRIEIGEELYDRQITTQEAFQKNREDFSNWHDYNSEYLKHAFNKEYNEYKKRYDDAGSFFFGIIGGRNPSPAEELTKFKNKVNSKLDNLKKLRAKTDLLKSPIQEKSDVSEKSITLDKSQVFIVHGHDDEAKTKTARFIEKLGLKSIILHEQASGSRTVIEKIEAYSNVGFGIILYTNCDIGAKAEENPNYKSRARQNVVFEHGFLIGKIGRENVCALVKGEIETPNDISGVVYVKMDEDEAWHLKIAKELRNSGYEIDMNKL